MSEAKFNVLFLGNGNSARSIMAEAILNRESGKLFCGYSAGIQAHAELDPHAIELLARLSFDTSSARSKSWNEFTGEGAPAFDFIFAVCESATLLPRSMWLGRPVFARWTIANPAMAEGNPTQIELAYADAFRMLSNRIKIFINLPLRSLDRLTMQRDLDAIDTADAKQTVVAA